MRRDERTDEAIKVKRTSSRDEFCRPTVSSGEGRLVTEGKDAMGAVCRPKETRRKGRSRFDGKITETGSEKRI